MLELENELKRLRPRAPSETLLAALERDRAGFHASRPGPARGAPPPVWPRGWHWAMWSAAGLAAAVAVALAVRSRIAPVQPELKELPPVTAAPAVPARSAPPDRYEPVQASSVLYALHESTPTTLPDRTEGREVRYRYVDTYTWKNPARNASVRWSVPRDEVRLVRAKLD